MSSEQTNALADAMIQRGEGLLDKTRREIDDGGEVCPVSQSLPKLVHWQSEVKLAELKAYRLNGQNGTRQKRSLKVGLRGIQMEGFDGMDVIRILALLALFYLIAERHGVLPWS